VDIGGKSRAASDCCIRVMTALLEYLDLELAITVKCIYSCCLLLSIGFLELSIIPACLRFQCCGGKEGPDVLPLSPLRSTYAVIAIMIMIELTGEGRAFQNLPKKASTVVLILLYISFFI